MTFKQIDASNGQVFGVNNENNIYTLHGDSWVRLPGSLKHVTVGPAGVWGVNSNNNIYKLVSGRWQLISGTLKQIDAGGDQFVVGLDANYNGFCLSNQSTISLKNESTLPWANISPRVHYYSCGLWGCWAVYSTYVYYRHDVTPGSCVGSRWQQVAGQLTMIEVGTEGTVYGVNSAGHVFRRDGINSSNPIGTAWTPAASFLCKGKHVSYDLGVLWVINTDGKTVKCRV
uniref:Fish-egg lectin n=1 Tax=Sphenodon punctatus TaxID=8508 RepID=A0A8D0GD08_SPHPU